jgi:acetylornithine deacetylase/succinyl-diaminopimelate desuccinylase-like protein
MIQETLQKFIAIPTIANDQSANQRGIAFVRELLVSAGFEVNTRGQSPYHQPVIVATFQNVRQSNKVVLYGHYDVEKIKASEKWNTPPFQLIEENGRLYCRGIADNKGVLMARMTAIQEMVANGEEIPEILWIIQGEEEVGGNTPFEIIPDLLAEFGSKIYVEETGVHKDGRPVVFHLSKSKERTFLPSLNHALYDGAASIENRSLRKFSKCPFLHSIPDDGHYIGFGPNDAQCNIHRENESLDKKLLLNHKEVFKRFLRWVNTTPIE